MVFRRIILSLSVLFLVTVSLSSGDVKNDFDAWKKWVGKTLDVENQKTQLYHIELIDGREFDAEKDGEDYIVRLQFGKLNISKKEVKSAKKTVSPETEFYLAVTSITKPESKAVFEKLETEFVSNRKIGTCLKWWKLYLEPGNKRNQLALRLMKKCGRCGGAGAIPDPNSSVCPECNGNPRKPCYSCGQTGQVLCPAPCDKNKYRSVYAGTSSTGGSYTHGSGLNPGYGKIRKDDTTWYVDVDGVKKTRTTTKYITCSKCNGTTKVKCTRCRGKGFTGCTKCYGKGRIGKTLRCPECEGSPLKMTPVADIPFPFLERKLSAAKKPKTSSKTGDMTDPARIDQLKNEGLLTAEEAEKLKKKIKLKKLMEEGILTKEEYNRKVKQLGLESKKTLSPETQQKLKRLKGLVDEGILTPQEFLSKAKQIDEVRNILLDIEKEYNNYEITRQQMNDRINELLGLKPGTETF